MFREMAHCEGGRSFIRHRFCRIYKSERLGGVELKAVWLRLHNRLPGFESCNSSSDFVIGERLLGRIRAAGSGRSGGGSWRVGGNLLG